MKFKDFQVLFSSIFKALNLGEENSSTFKGFQGCMGTQLVSTKLEHIKVKLHINCNIPAVLCKLRRVEQCLDDLSVTVASTR